MGRRTRSFVVPGAWILLALMGTCAGISACSRAPFLKVSSFYPPPGEGCAVCHPACFEEWRSSAHRAAATNPSYQALIGKVDVMECRGCHLPAYAPPLGGATPPPREIRSEDGVNCLACHGEACPQVRLEDKDESKAVDQTSPSASVRCGGCHRDTYAEWRALENEARAPGSSATCVTCHMPRKNRGEGHAGRVHRDHSCSGASPLTARLEILHAERTEEGGTRVDVRVHVEGPGHRVPSGHFGRKEVRLEAWMDDRPVTEAKVLRLFVERGEGLKPGWNGPYRLHLARGGKQVHLRLLRVRRDAPAPETELARLDEALPTGEIAPARPP